METGPAFTDFAACGIALTRDDGTFLRVNRTFLEWIGYPAEALAGQRRFQDLLTMGGRIFHQTHWAPLLRMQGSVSEVKFELVHRDGSRIPMVLNAIRREHDGCIVHEIAAFVARDRDAYERELVLSRKRLEKLVSETARLHAEAKDRALFAEQMVGIVSHDLRNPLSTVSVGVALLAQGPLSESQRGMLTRVSRSTDRAHRLITDLLDFTQARIGGGLEVTREPVDLHQVIAEAVEEVGFASPGRALEHVRIGQGQCLADANRLAQLTGNLTSNAVAYGAPEAPVTVTSAIDASSFAIRVHNRGAPIPTDAQARIFEPMARGTSAGAGRSVGLGLFIVRQIAHAHGGEIRVESGADEGTTFEATFPR